MDRLDPLDHLDLVDALENPVLLAPLETPDPLVLLDLQALALTCLHSLAWARQRSLLTPSGT